MEYLETNIEQIRLWVKENKTPAKAFTPPAETKMGTRPGRAVIREFIGGGYIHLFLFCPTNSFLNQLLLGYLPRYFTSKGLVRN